MVVLEVTRKAFLASLVPVIVNTILGEHQVVADIVAFVSHGDFPRSRLGEKQRGKVLASWVTRKLRTIAQFSIRDMDGDHPFADVQMQHRASRSSKPGSTMGNSMRMSTMPEDDVPAVPPSPAGVVLEEQIDAPQGTYQEMPRRGTLPELDTRTDHSAATPVPAATSAVPYIQEPQSATIMSADDDHFNPAGPEHSSTEANRDFRFSFDMVSTPMEQLPQQSAPPTHQHLPRGDSLPNHQASMAGPAYDQTHRPGTQESGLIDDWPAEALMYQSALGDDSQATAHGR